MPLTVKIIGIEPRFDQIDLRVSYDLEDGSTPVIVKDYSFQSLTTTEEVQTVLQAESARITTLYSKVAVLEPFVDVALDMETADLHVKEGQVEP